MARVARSLAAVLLAPRTHPRLGARVPRSRDERSCARLVSTSSLSAVNPDDDDDDVRSADVAVPVLIVGAGPVGLTLSALLSRFGVDHLVCERRARPSTHPQAHFVNNRTMEIFRPVLGLGASIARSQPPLEHWRRFVYCTGMARGVELGRVDHFDDGTHDGTHHDDDDDRHHREVSPASVAHFGQHRLVPALLQRAYALHPRGRDGFITGATLTDVVTRSPTARGASGKGTGDGAPGARGIQPRRRSKRLDAIGRRRRPRRRGWGQLARPRLVTGANDGYTRDAAPGERALHVPNARGAPETRRSSRHAVFRLQPRRRRRRRGARLEKRRIRRADSLLSPAPEPGTRLFASTVRGAPRSRRERGNERGDECALDDLEVRSVRAWTMSAEVADRFVTGNSRVVLCGDAAHRFPPAGGSA